MENNYECNLRTGAGAARLLEELASPTVWLLWDPVNAYFAGEVDLFGQLQALTEDGYRGVLTMENHYVPPGGRPEDGVRESLAGLRRLLERMR